MASGPAFCGWSTEEFQNLTRIGTETLNGATTTKYAAARDPAGDKWDATWEFWVTDAGQLTQMVIHMRDGKAKLVYYDFNEVNVITPPVGPTPTLSSGPTPTPTATATLTPTPEPTPTPPPTPEPTVTPTQVPASPDAWLEPNPKTSPTTANGASSPCTRRAYRNSTSPQMFTTQAAPAAPEQWDLHQTGPCPHPQTPAKGPTTPGTPSPRATLSAWWAAPRAPLSSTSRIQATTTPSSGAIP